MTLETTTLVDRVPLPTPMTARPDRQPIDWLELLVQVVLAAIGVVIAANLWVRRGVRGRRSY